MFFISGSRRVRQAWAQVGRESAAPGASRELQGGYYSGDLTSQCGGWNLSGIFLQMVTASSFPLQSYLFFSHHFQSNCRAPGGISYRRHHKLMPLAGFSWSFVTNRTNSPFSLPPSIFPSSFSLGLYKEKSSFQSSGYYYSWKSLY